MFFFQQLVLHQMAFAYEHTQKNVDKGVVWIIEQLENAVLIDNYHCIEMCGCLHAAAKYLEYILYTKNLLC